MDAYQTAVLTLTSAKAKELALQLAKIKVDAVSLELGALQSAAHAEILAAQALVGTVTVGIKSQLTQEAEAQRLVGISALIDAIKATPTLDPTAAQDAWVAGVSAMIGNEVTPLENPVGVVTAIMRIAGCADWNAFLALVAAGDKVDLMAAVS